MDRVILITYAEIALKGLNRPSFERRLVANAASATGLPASAFRRERGRIILVPPSEKRQRALNGLCFVFGIRAYAPAYRVAKNLAAITDACERVVRDTGPRGTFRISARRADKRSATTSAELNERLGAAVLDAFPEHSVDLHNPDLVVSVEIRTNAAYVYGNTLDGPGGLPVGVSGRGLLLLSGGIDSPAAGWLALKRGMDVDAISFHSPPFTGERAGEKVLDIARVLARWKTRPVRLFLLPFTEIQKTIARGAPEPYWTVLFRRAMHRVAERIAHREGYDALVTGDNLGQVASQTVENLAAIDGATPILTFRPLLTYDKHETIALAKRIGTYDLSILPYEDCCTVFLPKRPKTKTMPEELDVIEETLGLNDLLAQSAENAAVFLAHEDRIEEI